jgi:hypothetical protein
MKDKSILRVLPSKFVRVVLCGLLVFCAFSVSVATELIWVRLVSRQPPRYEAPTNIKPNTTLALKITPAVTGALSLRTVAFEGAFAHILQELNAAKLKSNSISSAQSMIVPFSGVDPNRTVQIEAWLYDADGRLASNRAILTIDPVRAAAKAPSTLTQALGRGMGLFNRLANLYDVVRDSPVSPKLFSVDLDVAGTPLTAPVVLNINVNAIHALALSASGDRMAWTTNTGELWLNAPSHPVELLLKAKSHLCGPVFLSDCELMLGDGREIVLISLAKDTIIRRIELPEGDISEIHTAAHHVGSLEAVLTVASGGASMDPPITFALNLPDNTVHPEMVRLPSSPLYHAYSAITKTDLLFAAGIDNGVEGIHEMNVASGEWRTLFRCVAPGPLAIASGGTRLVFVAEECEP